MAGVNNDTWCANPMNLVPRNTNVSFNENNHNQLAEVIRKTLSISGYIKY